MNKQPSLNTQQSPAAPSKSLRCVRDLARRGETQLATIEAIRLLVSGAASERAALLNDLAVLRHGVGDRPGAVACVSASLEADPTNQRARQNLTAMAAKLKPAEEWRSVDAERATGAATLNPWVVEALQAADQQLQLAGKHVLEVGGSVPPEAVRQLGVKHWTACDLRPGTSNSPDYTTLQADAGSLPLEDNLIDAAYSVCAFEHFQKLAVVLAEVHRVLRPGACLFTQFAPIWSSSVGHHVWLLEQGQSLVTFNDPVIPAWAHLVLTEAELRNFLTITRGESIAGRLVDYVWRGAYINRVSEGEFRCIMEASPFKIEVYEWWGGYTPPQAEMRAELERVCPDSGEFAAKGLRIVLRK